MFRVFGHLYCNHLSSVTSLGLHINMNICFKHYLYFIEQFELINSSELKPLNGFIQISLNRPFGKIYRRETTKSVLDQSGNSSNSSSDDDDNPDITAFSSIDCDNTDSHNSSGSKFMNTSNSQTRPSKEHKSKSSLLHEKLSCMSAISRNISRDIVTTESKGDIKHSTSPAPSRSVSVASQTLNSLTPSPTRYHDGESQSKINAVLQNRSVYEYVFNRNGKQQYISQTHDSTDSHLAIPNPDHNTNSTATVTRYYLDDDDMKDDYKEGAFDCSDLHQHDDEEKAMELDEANITFTGYTKYETPTKSKRDNSNGYRDLKIIRSSTRNTEAEKVDFLLSNHTLQRIPLLSCCDTSNIQPRSMMNNIKNKNRNTVNLAHPHSQIPPPPMIHPQPQRISIATTDIPPPPLPPSPSNITPTKSNNHLSVPVPPHIVDKGPDHGFAYSPYTEATNINVSNVAMKGDNHGIKQNLTDVLNQSASPQPMNDDINAPRNISMTMESRSPSFRDVVFYRSQVRVKCCLQFYRFSFLSSCYHGLLIDLIFSNCKIKSIICDIRTRNYRYVDRARKKRKRERKRMKQICQN